MYNVSGMADPSQLVLWQQHKKEEPSLYAAVVLQNQKREYLWTIKYVSKYEVIIVD